MSTHITYRLTWRGSQFGPFSLAEIRQKLAHGELNSMYQIHVDGRWMTLRDFLESDAARPPAAVASAPSYQPVQAAWQPAVATAARDTWGHAQTTAAQLPPSMPAMALPDVHPHAHGDGAASPRKRLPTWVWATAGAGIAALLVVVAAGALMYFTSGDAQVENGSESPQESVPPPNTDEAGLQLEEAVRLLEGDDIPQDIPAALAIFKKYAEMGNPMGQFYYGMAIYKGQGMPQDQAAASVWIEKSAQQGLPISQFIIGLCHLTGEGVARNPVKGVEWLTKAAMMGNGDAQYYLGLCHIAGDGVKVDGLKAYAWLELSAGGGHKAAAALVEQLSKKMNRAQLADAFRIAQDLRSKLLTDSNFKNMPDMFMEANGKSTGTGFFITTDGYFITNHHVVDGATVVKVRTAIGVLNATIVELDHANDLALLKLTGKFDAVPVISSKDVVLGNTVATVGFPTSNILGSSPKLAKGEVAALTGVGGAQRLFQVSLPVQPGNSGGALVDERGNVIGVVASKLTVEIMMATAGTLPENINFAVKSALVLDLIKRVPGLSDHLLKANTSDRKFEAVVKDVQKASALIMIF